MSENTLNSWIRMYEEIGKVEDKRKNNGSQKRFSNEKLKEFYETNTNATLEDGGKEFKVTAQAINKRLKQMNYSFKKKRGNIKKEMKKAEVNI